MTATWLPSRPHLDIDQWLDGIELHEYVDCFRPSHGVEDLLYLDEADIKALGIKNGAHRAKIVSSLFMLRSKFEKMTVAELQAAKSSILETDEGSGADNGDDAIKTTESPYLPPEILSAIIGMLPVADKGRASRVSRLWNDVAYMPAMWLDVAVPFTMAMDVPNNPTVGDSLERRHIRGAVLKFVDEYCSESMRELFDRLQRCMPELEFLTIDLDTMSGATFLHHTSFVGCATRLTELTIKKSDGVYSMYLPPKVVQAITTRLKNLVKFDMTGFHFNDLLLIDISRGLVKLTHLTLGTCRYVTDVGIGHLTGSVGGVEVGHPKLTSLVLLNVGNVTDASIKYLGTGQSGLRSLTFDYITLITIDGAKYLTLLVNLEKLNLLGRLGPGSLSRLVSLKQLRVLKLSNSSMVGDADMLALSTMAQLRELDVSFLCGVSDSSWGLLAKMPGLRNLIVNSCSLSDAGLQFLADGGSRITRLSISYSYFPFQGWPISDRGLLHISRLAGLGDLRLVQLGPYRSPNPAGELGNVRGCGFRYLSTGTARITRLDISRNHWHCPLLLMHVSRMSQLTSLVLSRRFCVGDEDAQLLAESLPRLTIDRVESPFINTSV